MKTHDAIRPIRHHLCPGLAGLHTAGLFGGCGKRSDKWRGGSYIMSQAEGVLLQLTLETVLDPVALSIF